MKNILLYNLLGFICFLYFINTGLYGESALKDPDIPNGEAISYQVTLNKEQFPLFQLTNITSSPGKEIYRITTKSKREDSIIQLDKVDMKVIRAWILKKNMGFEVEVESRLHNDNNKFEPDKLVLFDFEGINHVLRGFPFKTKKKLKIKSVQSGNLVMYIKQIKETVLTTEIGDISCYLLELGMEDFIGFFLPKTYFWYSKERPHYCVKFKGQTGPPGSPKMTIMITAYNITK